MNTFYRDLGKNVWKYRKKAKISQDKLAKKLGLHQSSISMIEYGRRVMTTEELMKTSELLDITIEKLVGRQ